ncbi:Bcr/CflA family efflux MFS transporter [Nocardioides guangzhouensis]|uniref:Bcr/CflA family efflux MFS transporter n=1 Tax=Nocardioides guangzhouensis TaxID=2497878 RepID=A0A4Q4Z833_9ACTN|nr:multidrug effflux MFS transporter [Nocardioides guangzhouensis]RYP84027.1 Bcr/CflA family efflux MFS transporter [Nocardioides guangzhouensis]
MPLLLTLALLAAFAPIATDLYLPGFPAMAGDLGSDASGVQLTLTAFLAGLAVGQLVMGPMSDRLGRRGPLIGSALLCVAAGVVSATAPTLGVLVAARVVQGFAGAGGMVIGRAVIADLLTGRAAARAFTIMLTVGGVAPVLAPLVGGLLSEPIGWRGMLWTVTGLCCVMLVAVVAVVPETRPRSVRDQTGAPYLVSVRRVLHSRGYWSHTGVFALSFAMMMAYISASPFVYQHVLGLTEVQYGAAFGVNAVGLIANGALVSRMVDVVEPERIVGASLALQVTATVGLVVLVLVHAPGWTYAVAIFLAVLSNGGIMGTSASLAMGRVREVAGAGSAIMGFSQFALGAVVSPLVGLGGIGSALVPAVVMATASVGAALVRGLAGSRRSAA